MDQEDLYDEFGNYVGPELDGSEEEDEDQEFPDDRMDLINENNHENLEMALVNHDENKIVLHEDKKYYPTASEVYPGVRTITLDEDAQDLSEPIIKPIRIKNFSVLEKTNPTLNYSSEFVAALMKTPNLIRNVAVLGHFHHGKTLFVDTLVMATQESEWNPSKEVRYADTRKDEQERELSIKSTMISLVLENLKSKSYLINILDCPGHINFCDESTAALRAADGAVIIVDVLEGIMLSTERLLKHALLAQVPICLVKCFLNYLLLLLLFITLLFYTDR
jgi:U5 small nuclear ribonucleoprotein component